VDIVKKYIGDLKDSNITDKDGYLIPEDADTYRGGLIASLWRRIGTVFKRDDWYRRGITVIHPAQELREMLKRLKYEK